MSLDHLVPEPFAGFLWIGKPLSTDIHVGTFRNGAKGDSLALNPLDEVAERRHGQPLPHIGVHPVMAEAQMTRRDEGPEARAVLDKSRGIVAGLAGGGLARVLVHEGQDGLQRHAADLVAEVDDGPVLPSCEVAGNVVAADAAG